MTALRAKKRSQPVRKRRAPWLILSFVVLLSASCFFLVWPFWQLAGQFGSHPSKKPSRLYGSSIELSVGISASIQRLVTDLHITGYRQVDDSTTLRPGTFSLAERSGSRADGRLRVHRRSFVSAAGPRGSDLLEIEVTAGQVATLQLDGQPTSTARLEPPLIASYYDSTLQERRPIRIDEVSEDLILAVLAAEDTSFLRHSGLSLSGILRAAWVNLREQEVRQGGSTLTQQLVKNLYLSHDRNWWRKLREAVLALLVEARYEKREILQAYLNEIYWGRSGRIHLMGVGAAAWAYFHKHPAQLDLAEAALLAGMIQSPATLSPLTHRDDARQRRDLVLNRLAELEWIPIQRLEQAAATEIRTRPGNLIARRAPYFSDFVSSELERRFGITELRNSGYSIHSTLSLQAQNEAEAAIDWGLEALEEGWEKGRRESGTLQAALVSIDPRNGAITAYVGGRDYRQSQFDRLAQARRQVGSAFKPVVFATAFAQRTAHPAMILDDAPLSIELDGRIWSPQNSDRRYRGPVTSRHALETSLNVPTARLALRTGLDEIVSTAHAMGIESPIDPYPALALGAMAVSPLEVATVYSTLAGSGTRPPIHGLTAVYDREGTRIEGTHLPQAQVVIDAGVAYLVTSLLQGVLDRGTAKSARAQGIGDPLAVKTGTTNDGRDSWLAGYSPSRVSLVWVGYDDNSTTRLSGAKAALPIWARFTQSVRPRKGYSEFAVPQRIVRGWVDRNTGGLATTHCPTVSEEVFLRDFAPQVLCPDHGGMRRSRPLEQPEIRPEEDRRHPFRRWLDSLRRRRGSS